MGPGFEPLRAYIRRKVYRDVVQLVVYLVWDQGVARSSRVIPTNKINGAIAQLVEHRTENPCVPGSNPGGTTKLYRGVEQLVARQAHNLEVVRSSRAPATNFRKMLSFEGIFLFYIQFLQSTQKENSIYLVTHHF